MKLRKFEDHLNERLREPEYAAIYVETALEQGGIEEFLYALREVIVAQEGGMQRVAAESRRGRESMYKSLSKQGNPRIKTLDSILHSVGMRITVTRDEAVSRETERPEVLAHA